MRVPGFWEALSVLVDQKVVAGQPDQRMDALFQDYVRTDQGYLPSFVWANIFEASGKLRVITVFLAHEDWAHKDDTDENHRNGGS